MLLDAERKAILHEPEIQEELSALKEMRSILEVGSEQLRKSYKTPGITAK